MAKPVKSFQLYTRVDAELKLEVDLYIKAAHTDVSDLLRKAVKEYMLNNKVEEK